MTTLQEQAYQHIRKGLLGGEWMEGDFLFPSKVAKEIGISYTPVREAMIQLVGEGVLQQLPKAGVCVRTLGPDELRELFELRGILEGGAVCLAAQRISDETLAQLSALMDQHEQAVEKLRASGWDHTQQDLMLNLGTLDLTFHLNVIAAAQNQKMMKMISDLHVLTRIFHRRLEVKGDEFRRQTEKIITHHRNILNALSEHDSEKAHECMLAHLTWAQDFHMAVTNAKSGTDGLIQPF